MASQKRSKTEQPEEAKLRVLIIQFYSCLEMDSLLLELPKTVVEWLDTHIQNYNSDGAPIDSTDLIPDLIGLLAPTDEMAARITKEFKEKFEDGNEVGDFWDRAQDEWFTARLLPGSSRGKPISPTALMAKELEGLARIFTVLIEL